jgi:MFS family permease
MGDRAVSAGRLAVVPASSDAEVRRRTRRILAPLTVFVFASAALQTAVIPALPTMQSDLGVTTTGIAWVLTAPVLVSSVALPILGRLGDMLGRRRVVTVMAGVSAFGCLIAAMWNSLPALVAGRALQGLSMGAFSVCFAILRDKVHPSRRAGAYGLLSAMWGVAAATAFSFSGALVDRFGYHSIFWVALLLLAGSGVAIRLLVPESPPSGREPIDWLGALLFAPGLTLVLLALSQGVHWGWSSPAVISLFALGVMLLLGWVWRELHTEAPLTDLRLLGIRAVRAVDLNAMFGSASLFALFVVTPKLAQTPSSLGYGLSASATVAGLYFLPMAVTQFAGSLMVVRLRARFGTRPVMVSGMLIMAGGYAVFEALLSGPWGLLVAVSCGGIGTGITNTAAVQVLAWAVPQSQIGETNGMTTMLRNVGASFASTVTATILAASLVAGTGYVTETGYRIVIALGGLAALAAAAACMRVPDLGPRS